MLGRVVRETATLQADADADIDRYLFASTTSALGYRTYLSRMYGILAPLENALHAAPGLSELIDLDARAKAAFVLQDLLALGLTREGIMELPLCLGIPTFRGPASALGWMYIVEQPMLAAPVIRHHLETRIPAEIARASAYLSCHDGMVGTRWRELGVAMDKVATTPAIADRIVEAAQEAFRTLHRWRTLDVSRVAARRAAS